MKDFTVVTSERRFAVSAVLGLTLLGVSSCADDDNAYNSYAARCGTHETRLSYGPCFAQWLADDSPPRSNSRYERDITISSDNPTYSFENRFTDPEGSPIHFSKNSNDFNNSKWDLTRDGVATFHVDRLTEQYTSFTIRVHDKWSGVAIDSFFHYRDYRFTVYVVDSQSRSAEEFQVIGAENGTLVSQVGVIENTSSEHRSVSEDIEIEDSAEKRWEVYSNSNAVFDIVFDAETYSKPVLEDNPGFVQVHEMKEGNSWEASSYFILFDQNQFELEGEDQESVYSFTVLATAKDETEEDLVLNINLIIEEIEPA